MLTLTEKKSIFKMFIENRLPSMFLGMRMKRLLAHSSLHLPENMWSGVKSWRGAFFLCGASYGGLRPSGSKLRECVSLDRNKTYLPLVNCGG